MTLGWVSDSARIIAALQQSLPLRAPSSMAPGGRIRHVMEAKKPALWTSGGRNAFFGFGTNILVNQLTLSGLLRFELKMPDNLVFRRILPAAGMMMFLSTLYHAWLAYQLAKKTGRDDVCALPSGISVPHMFIVTLVIMLPIKLKIGDPIQGWEARLTWVFIGHPGWRPWAAASDIPLPPVSG
jgi:hypothetical protein